MSDVDVKIVTTDGTTSVALTRGEDPEQYAASLASVLALAERMGR